MRQLVALLLFLAAAAGAQPAPDGSPLWIAERLFDPDGFPEIAEYARADAVPTDSLGQLVAFGPVIEPGTAVSLELMGLDSTTAVVASRLVREGETLDLYLHFAHEAGRWRLVAYRSLWLPGVYIGLVHILETWEAARGRPDPGAAFWEALDPSLAESMELDPDSVNARDLAELDSMLVALPNMRLVTGSDSTLRAHFQSKRAAFDAIASSFPADSTDQRIQAEDDTDIARLLTRLHLRSARREAYAGPYVFVIVGGMIDNEVGYLYAPDGVEPPPMSPNRFIYVEALGDGWYLYKTT